MRGGGRERTGEAGGGVRVAPGVREAGAFRRGERDALPQPFRQRHGLGQLVRGRHREALAATQERRKGGQGGGR